MYFGSAQPLNREHLRRLCDLTRRTKTPWLSDHLCWGSVDGRYTHQFCTSSLLAPCLRSTGATPQNARRRTIPPGVAAVAGNGSWMPELDKLNRYSWKIWRYDLRLRHSINI